MGILQMLGVLEGTGFEKAGAGSATAVHYMTEAMRHFFADRSENLGDPDFLQVPLAALLNSRVPGPKIRASIDAEKATPSSQVKGTVFSAHESAQTTHYTIADAQGNVVAVTYTLNDGYGSKVTATGLGFLLNDEMDDFASQPGRGQRLRAGAGRSRRHRAAQDAALFHDADHRAARRQAVPGAGLARRADHHQYGAGSAGERDRLEHERAGRGELAALSPRVDAGRAADGAGLFAGYHRAAASSAATP